MMNPDPTAGRKLYERLEDELTAMIASGILDPENWFNAAAFTPEEAIRWDGLGFTTGGALEWCAAFHADKVAIAAWARVGMATADPSLVAEALAVGLDPLRWQFWRIQGFSAPATIDWSDRRFTLDDALSWIESGVPEPSQAAEWTARGFGDPAAAKRWRVAIREVAEIATEVWVEVGFTAEEAALARLVTGVDRPPELADRVPGDMAAAIAAGRADRDRHRWMVNYRPR